MGKRINNIKRFFFWLFALATTICFFKIIAALSEESGTFKTGLLICMIYFGWLAVMLKDG